MITVIAGVNGAGKSSIAGANIRSHGGEYFNPDEAARIIRSVNPELSDDEVNGQAWQVGYEQLLRAIEDDTDYTFETTLGGTSICDALHEAIQSGRSVRIFFCGLLSPELHIHRVAERVARGGHDIPEHKIRERWNNSILNLMGLIPLCQAVKVIDNSAPMDTGGPHPICLFSMINGKFVDLPIKDMPVWAKPLATAALERAVRASA